MRLRNWLLTGTGLGFLALSPLPAAAQPDPLTGAYRAYVMAQRNGNAEAQARTQQALTEQCIVAGYASLEECIAALAETTPMPGGPPAAPGGGQPPTPPGGAMPAAPGQPAAPPQQPAPEPPAQPAPEQPAPQQPAPEQPATQPQQAAPEQPAAPAPQAPAPEAPAQQPAPQTQPAPSQPAPQQQAPANRPDPMALAEQQITRNVALYNGGVAKLAAGDASGQADIDGATARLQAVCRTLGFDSLDACVAEYGLALDPIPAAQPAPAPEQPAPAQPAPQQRPTPSQPPAGGQPPAAPNAGADQPVTETTAEPLPENVQPEEAAPLLDSAKQLRPQRPGQPGQPGQATPPAPPSAPPAPAPKSDADAQAGMQAPAEPPSVAGEQGRPVGPGGITFTPPPNVTVVNPPAGQQPPAQQPPAQQPPAQQPPAQQPQASAPVSLPQFILQLGSNLIIQSLEQDRSRIFDPGEDIIYYEQLSGGRVRETIERPDGSKVVTVRARDGSIIRRSRITPDGREYILAYGNDDPDFASGNWRDPGEDLPPLRLNIPARDYVLDARDANEEQVRRFFAQPPVEQVRRIYTIDEVKHSARIRDSVRRLEIGNLTFDTGKATISRDQVGALSDVAEAMLNLLDRNPAETFLIEGHTDAVGSFESNLVLSDARAATVARILTDFYGVPPENLVTQGYGEQFLKVRTLEAERLNRRVTIRRITPLITIAGR